MNALTPNPRFQSAATSDQSAFDALGPYLGGVTLAQSAEHDVSRQISMLLLLQKIGAAHGSTAFVVDDKNRGIPVAFNSMMLLPQATGKRLAQDVNDLLVEVAAQSADSFNKKHAAREAESLAYVEQVKQLKFDLKKAATDVARYTVLSTQLARLNAQEPQDEGYEDFDERLATHRVRIVALEQAHAQAKADGNAEFAAMLRQELKATRLEEPQSYDTEHRRWQTLFDPLASEVARFEGAVEREACLRDALAAHIANEPKKLVAPKLVFLNTPMPVIRKSLGMAQLGSMQICTGDGIVKALAKHGDIVSEMCSVRGSSIHRVCPVQLTIFGVTTSAALARDLKALGADDVDLLSLMHIVTDSPYPDMGFGAGLYTPAILTEFDEAIKVLIGKKLVDDFEVQLITLENEATFLLTSTAESIRVFRGTDDMPRVMDAYLMRMPQYICGMAGLLYMGRGETGPLSVNTMRNAMDICRWLTDEFGRAVLPTPEAPAEHADAWTVRYAVQSYVDKNVQCNQLCPLTIALSMLYAKSGSIGLTKARIRRAVEFMHRVGWVHLRRDGLDHLVDINPHHFFSERYPQ